jgi:preprotein translocase subunit SecE
VSPVSVLMKLSLYRYDLGMFRRKFQKLVKSTIGLITWPSKLIDELEREIQEEKKNLRPCLITVFLFFLVMSVITYYANTLGGWLLFTPVLLFICSFQIIILYFRDLYNRAHIFRGNWIHQVQKSESIQLEETIDEIFNLLQSEFPYPLRFYFTGEYPKLTYTGRTVTSYAFNPLKEAVFYPQNVLLTVSKEKEEPC